MWIVQLALRRPYTSVVMAILILVLGITSVTQMRTDIFPEIDIPVVTMIWTYKGMDAEEFEKRITTFAEYALSGNVSDVKKIESQTLSGVSVIKIFFYQGANVGVAVSHASVPQSSALGIKPGDQAWVTVPEKPGQILAAKVARTSGAVDPISRSLLVEVELPNPKSELLPGLYVQVRFQSPNAQANFVIPAQVLQMRSTGPQVIEVLSDGSLRTHKLTLGRDLGKGVEVLSGLLGDERLVLNPSDDLRDGQIVEIAASIRVHNQIARK